MNIPITILSIHIFAGILFILVGWITPKRPRIINLLDNEELEALSNGAGSECLRRFVSCAGRVAILLGAVFIIYSTHALFFKLEDGSWSSGLGYFFPFLIYLLYIVRRIPENCKKH
ncbi:MAG: hypothetical protein LBH04_04640 [Tannerellaceae bacterium]|nr:hypothetical protein [Tannerellaceae bacterium]